MIRQIMQKLKLTPKIAYKSRKVSNLITLSLLECIESLAFAPVSISPTFETVFTAS